MKHRHVILEGKPTTGKTETSNLFRIFFPGRVIVLPELTTVLVRQHALQVMRDRRRLADLLRTAVPARAIEVRRLRAECPESVVFEESHMGVHWAYSQVAGDRAFLDIYDEHIRPHVLVPDLYLRLDIPIALSEKRQAARQTPDVEVHSGIISDAFRWLDRWHAAMGTKNLVIVNTNRSPDVVVRAIMDAMAVEYEPWPES